MHSPNRKPWASPRSLACRFGISTALQLVEAPEPEEKVLPWTGEPKDLNEMMDTYIIENKLPAGIAGGMLYITKATARDGASVNILENQKHKLFFALGLQEEST